MQKLLTLFVTFILSVIPIVNASASLPSCDNVMPKTLSMPEPHSMNDVTTVDTDTSTNDSVNMASMHDCCNTPNQNCDHVSACDCENSQVNYTSVPVLKVQHPHAVYRLKPDYLSSQFLSKPTDSLYRPPINIFI